MANNSRRRPDVSFAAVKAVTDLADLAAECGVELNRYGMGLCPFHDDRRPSLSVRGERWHCFGCGEGGDAFDWCERFYRMDTAGALRYLAKRAGFTLGPGGAGVSLSPAAAAEIEAARRKKMLRDRFFSWMHDERGKNADLIRRLELTLDLVVKTPDDLGTDRAQCLYDMRAKLEGRDELLWDRDWEALVDYYRERTIGTSYERY